MYKGIYRITCMLILVCISNVCQAQPPENAGTSGSFTMAAGSHFKASRWKMFWWGRHWRDEWQQQVNFPLFNPDTVAGGLTPLEKGGGHETKTLRLLGKNGKEYVLRTMDKSLDVLIPEVFKGSFANDLVNDQISTAHPYGPLSIAYMSGSIGLMHTNPVIVYVPANARLGDFKSDFAGKLCLFEERPSGEGWERTPFTNNASEIINSEKLFQKLRNDHTRQVDQPVFLKARLFDMVINDWDRHFDQWIWAGHKKNGKTMYEAFARDRDQAFSKTDGVNMFIFSRPWAIRSLQNMTPRVTDVIGTNLSATMLDRQFTTALTEADWHNTIITLQQQLTDSVIGTALRQMPALVDARSHDFLYDRLRKRRDDMLNFGMRYYRILNKEVTLAGTDDPEIFTINKTDDHTTEITIHAIAKKTGTSDTVFHRIFTDDVTKEINIYGQNGNDSFVFTGRAKNNIKVRALGAEGTDLYTDSTTSPGGGKKTRIYDVPGNTLQLSRAYNTHITADTAYKTYNMLGYRYDWWAPLILPSVNPDDGFLIGAGLIYKKQQWGKSPYGWLQSFGGSYAASTGAYSLFYNGKFRQVIGKWDINAKASYKAPTYVINFYGYGNNTRLSTTDKAFYRVRSKSVALNPGIGRTWEQHSFEAGLLFNTYRIEASGNKFINQPSQTVVDPSVFHTKYFAGINSSYDFNSANSPNYPTKGIHYTMGAAYLRNVNNGQRDFASLNGSFTFYFTPVKNITIAHRTGASGNTGDFEFYQASTLGGMENLRGYWRTRFAGSSSFYQNTDLRLKLTRLKGYVLRGDLGVYGFFDDGRVWYKNDQSGKLHSGYGGGLYFIPYNLLALNISYACSKEVNVFAIRAGFLF